MEIARREFQIPMVLEPEYLASPFLDELSGMTYLSYFMKEDSPGFHATLRWVKNQIPDAHVRNFTVSNLLFVKKITIRNAEQFCLRLSVI
jgi:filamin